MSSYSSITTTSPRRYVAQIVNRSLLGCYNNRASGTLLYQKSLGYVGLDFSHERAYRWPFRLTRPISLAFADGFNRPQKPYEGGLPDGIRKRPGVA